MTSFESALPEKVRSIVSKDLPHAEHLPGEFYTLISLGGPAASKPLIPRMVISKTP
jgi:hypothetical protein